MVIKRIAKALPIYLLKKNLAWVYKKYKAFYCKKS